MTYRCGIFLLCRCSHPYGRRTLTPCFSIGPDGERAVSACHTARSYSQCTTSRCRSFWNLCPCGIPCACGEHGRGEERSIPFLHKKSSSHTRGTRGGLTKGVRTPPHYSFVHKSNITQCALSALFLPPSIPSAPRRCNAFPHENFRHTASISPARRRRWARLPPAVIIRKNTQMR